MKPKKYVVSLSGGKDSTAMLLRLIAEKRPIDYIIFCDTGLEFPQMYEHISKLEKYINRPIIRLKAEHDFSAIIAGGWISVIVIIVLCLVGALASSFYRIFFSTETSESGMNISTVIQEINADYDNKIDELKASGSRLFFQHKAEGIPCRADE